jgi:hypothetical protein
MIVEIYVAKVLNACSMLGIDALFSWLQNYLGRQLFTKLSMTSLSRRICWSYWCKIGWYGNGCMWPSNSFCPFECRLADDLNLMSVDLHLFSYVCQHYTIIPSTFLSRGCRCLKNHLKRWALLIRFLYVELSINFHISHP